MQYEKLFRTQSVWRSIFQMAVPAVVIILVMIIYNLTDMFFIGRLGDYTLVAAISLASPLFSLASAAATMLGSGASAKIAKALGNNDKDQAKICASLCFWGAVILGIIIGAAIIIFADRILPLLGAADDTREYTKAYMCVCALGEPFMLASMSLGSVIRAEGAIKEGMIGNLGATIINIILDPLFILAFGWGVAGAAAATVIGNLCGTLYYVWYMLKKASVMNMRPKLALKKPALLFPLLALGLPSALSTLLSGFASTFSNRILAGYGTDAVAAMAAAGKTTMVIGMLQIGICMGIQPLIAYNCGAGDIKRLKEILKKTAFLTVAVGTVSGILCLAGKDLIVSAFITDESTAQLSASMIPLLVAASPVVGLIYLSTNFIQALGKAAPATLISLLRQGIFLIPLLYIMSAAMGLGGIPAAYMAADLLSVCVSLILLFWQYRKFKTP